MNIISSFFDYFMILYSYSGVRRRAARGRSRPSDRSGKAGRDMKDGKREAQLLCFDENYYKKITSSFDRLGGAEKKAASYILEHGAICARMSVSELAQACGCSAASIVRLCKDLGYSGFSELKFNIQQSGYVFTEGNLSISQTDSPAALVEKTFHYTQQSLNTMVQLLDNELLEHASQAIAKANLVLFCAMGSACGAALAGVNHLLSSGINACFPMDDLLQLRAAAYSGPSDVVIGVNYDGNAKNVSDALMIAKERGATTILITSFPNGLGAHYADIILRTPKRNANNALNYSTTTMCQVMIVHLLIVGAWQWGDAARQEQSSKMRALTYLKRYAIDTSKIEVKPVKQ